MARPTHYINTSSLSLSRIRQTDDQDAMLNGYDPVTGVGNMANLNSKVGAGGSVVPRWGYLFRGVKRGRPWARAARTLLSLQAAALQPPS